MLCNKFRSHQITKKMMVIMWFSGLRGAIAYALSLHLEFDDEIRKVLVTTTLIVVLFTTIVLGGGTLPLMKYLESKTSGRNRRKRSKEVTMSKTSEFGSAIDSEHLSELTEEEVGVLIASIFISSNQIPFRLSRASMMGKCLRKDSCSGTTNSSDLSLSGSKWRLLKFCWN